MTSDSLVRSPIEQSRPHRERPLVAVVAAIALVFMAIQVAAEVTDYGFRGAWMLSLENESGLAERLGEVMAVGAALFLLAGRRRAPSRAAAAWASVWLYVAADDALRIHERVGEAIGSRTGAIGPLDPHVVGEMIFMATVGLLLLGLVVSAELREGRAISGVSRAMLVPATIFGFFSVIFDVAASEVPYSVAIEDGAEMFALGLALVAALRWYRSIGDERSADGP